MLLILIIECMKDILKDFFQTKFRHYCKEYFVNIVIKRNTHPPSCILT